jgi:hypothetical protein
VKDTPKASADDAPEPSALEKMEQMRDLTRRLVAVPKAEIDRERGKPDAE